MSEVTTLARPYAKAVLDLAQQSGLGLLPGLGDRPVHVGGQGARAAGQQQGHGHQWQRKGVP